MAKAAARMAHPLYLTAEERKLFDSLPEKLREGWIIKEEKGTYQETEQKRMLRLTFLNLHDPQLRAFQDKAKNARTHEEFLKLIEKVDLRKASQEDLAELFFGLGSEGMSVVIQSLLPLAKTDEDLNGISFISTIRNGFYETAPKK